MPKLKVWFGNVYPNSKVLSDPQKPWRRQFPAAIAATSQVEVARLARTTVGDVAKYWSCVRSDTKSTRGQFAFANPHRLWAWTDDYRPTADGAVDVTGTP